MIHPHIFYRIPYISMIFNIKLYKALFYITLTIDIIKKPHHIHKHITQCIPGHLYNSCSNSFIIPF